ncbi:MAG: BlaI/MecI/CopY family transcriptional regulator [Acidobacteria bacterium]|nr:BlaI/MecI/CopY family transcriptional regulator [Acidobacteriota bacterium]
MNRIRPTPGEWEILQALWKLGPATVREVHESIAAERPVQYTTTLKLMQILAEKGLVARDESARAHQYRPAVEREDLQADAAEDLLERVFGGSAAELMQRALSRRKPKKSELKELRKTIDAWEGRKG